MTISSNAYKRRERTFGQKQIETRKWITISKESIQNHRRRQSNSEFCVESVPQLRNPFAELIRKHRKSSGFP
eukprot:scaffold5529_cov117-Cylindrotheca_fusiformis.AAC.40